MSEGLYSMEAKDYDKTLDLTKIKPYGDTMNDGKTQLSFTLPVPAGAEAEEAAAEAEEADEYPFCEEDDPPIIFIEDAEEEMPETVCVFCGAAGKDDEDDSFCEKELSRLYKVRNGLEIKAARMLYVYQANDKSLSADARKKRMEKLEATKAWRGLQFDLNYVNNEINGLEDYIKRG